MENSRNQQKEDANVAYAFCDGLDVEGVRTRMGIYGKSPDFQLVYISKRGLVAIVRTRENLLQKLKRSKYELIPLSIGPDFQLDKNRILSQLHKQKDEEDHYHPVLFASEKDLVGISQNIKIQDYASKEPSVA